MKKKSVTNYETPKFMKSLALMLGTAGILSSSTALAGCATNNDSDMTGGTSVFQSSSVEDPETKETYDYPELSGDVAIDPDYIETYEHNNECDGTEETCETMEEPEYAGGLMIDSSYEETTVELEGDVVVIPED